MIQINNLNKSYGSTPVLHQIDITLSPGKVYGLVGENGAGKTTLFRCIAGLESYEGTIECNTGVLKNQLGYLPTEPFYFSKITGEEYIRLLCNAREITINNIEEKNVFNLPLEKFASTYSTGMKKQLALTAILFLENQYYIFDEPFNGVDIHSSMIITEIIHQLKNLNKTIIISSHIFSTLKDTCDEILILKEKSISKKVNKNDFSMLEQELKEFTVGDKVKMLGLK